MGSRIAAAGLIVLMAIGSIALWIAIPLGWLLLASRLTDSSQPSIGPYFLVIVGIPATMFAMGKLLAQLNGAYEDVTGKTSTVGVQLPWHRSLRGEREGVRPTTVLDVVMICSVSIAVVAFGIWFLFLAEGGGLPG
jgi:hypothetical protein